MVTRLFTPYGVPSIRSITRMHHMRDTIIYEHRHTHPGEGGYVSFGGEDCADSILKPINTRSADKYTCSIEDSITGRS